MFCIRQKVQVMWYVVLLLLLIPFCISGCGTTHQTYLYHGPASFEGDQYAGINLSVPWQAQPGPVMMDSSPTPLVLQISLIGPFQQIDDVLHAIRKYKNDPVLTHMGPVVATAPSIQTDNWTNRTFTSVISFPTTLQPGYYTLALTVNGDATTRANAIIRIHAHS